MRRDDFPILDRCTYLCSHSLGAVPAATEQALQEYHREWATLGVRAWDGPWWQAVLDFGAAIEAVLGAAPGTVVPLQNATRGMAAVASCFDWSGARNRIVMTDSEFTTSYPFWLGQAELGAVVDVVPADELPAAIDDRTALVPTSHVHFRSGRIADLAAITRAAHARGAMVLGDGYQAAGTVPLDVQSLGVDFYVGGCHKWLCGGPGAGYLYVRPDRIGQLRPRLTGWFGLESPFAYEVGTGRPPPHEGILRFLGGTPNVPALYAAREGLRIVGEVGIQAIRAHSQRLTARIVKEADVAGLDVRSPRDPDARSGMICLDFDGARAASDALIERDVIVDYRADCGIRLSPHFYNDESDIEAFFETLAAVR